VVVQEAADRFASIGASLRRRAVRVLLYHSISDDDRDPLAVALDLFRAHMDVLADSGTPVVSTRELLEASNAPGGPRRGAICISFDDGFEDFATSALPILRQYRLPSTLFVATGLVGKDEHWSSWARPRRFLDWSELRNLAAEDVEVGGHTVSHPHLSTLPLDAVSSELRECRTVLAAELPCWLDAIAYPYGDQSADVRRLAREAGYRAGFLAGGLWGNRLGSDPFALRRHMVRPSLSPARLRRVIGGWDDVETALREGRARLRRGPS
jgi:peptidoglycan/xylan/chitin deacetylase (PgdA/CDA1 family)